MENNFSQNQKTDIVKMYNDNVAIDTIMEIYNSNEHDIRVVLKEFEADRHYNSWSDELYNRMFYLYEHKKTQKEIAYDLVVSSSIGSVLKKKQIERRTYSEANRKHGRNSEYFDNINTPNKAYVLGLIYADGNNYIWGSKHCLTISLQESDKALLERVKEELEYTGDLRFVPLKDKNPNHNNQYVLAITDEHMCLQLKEIGVVQRKSLILKFPKFLRPDLIRHFVRGYFDGDGCLSYNQATNKEMAGIVGTFEFCSAVSGILHAMFVKNYIYKPNKTLSSNTYEMRTTGNLSSYKFLSWIYRDCDIKLDRKYQKYLEFCERYINPKGRIKSL